MNKQIMVIPMMPTVSTSYMSAKTFDEAIKQLGEFVAIPSVSNPGSEDHNPLHLAKAAKFAGSILTKIGFTVSYPCIEKSSPYVLAHLFFDINRPTILLYSHYDVQPVDKTKWKSNPFILVEKEGRLYGRGASDDKAGISAILTAIKVCIEAKIKLPNIKILFEGEEEIGSPHINKFLQKERLGLEADALIVLDGANITPSIGTLTSSTRGVISIHLKVTGLEKPVHSGIGCLAPDPAQDLAFLISSLRDPKKVPGVIQDIEPIKEGEKRILQESSISPEKYASEMGMLPGVKLRGDPKRSVYEKILDEPSITIIWMICGQRDGGNSVQDSAECMISIRNIVGQDPDKVAKGVIDYLKVQAKKLESGMKVEITKAQAGSWAWKANLTHQFTKMYFESLKKHYPSIGAMPCGGALPLIREFESLFPKMEVIVPGVEDPDTNAHSHNESQDKEVFKRSINSLVEFLQKAGQMSKSPRSRL